MRHRRLALCVLVLLASVAAHANSIPVFQITFEKIVLFAGGAMAFGFTGPGIAIGGSGAFACNGWCFSGEQFVAEGTPIQFGSFDPNPCCMTIQIGGKDYSGGLNAWTMNTFNTLFVPDCCGTAILNGNGLILGSINTANGTLPFELRVPVGDLELSFVQSGDNPSNWGFSEGLFIKEIPAPVPEPATVVLLMTGLAGVFSKTAFSHRRLRKKQP